MEGRTREIFAQLAATSPKTNGERQAVARVYVCGAEVNVRYAVIPVIEEAAECEVGRHNKESVNIG